MHPIAVVIVVCICIVSVTASSGVAYVGVDFDAIKIHSSWSETSADIQPMRVQVNADSICGFEFANGTTSLESAFASLSKIIASTIPQTFKHEATGQPPHIVLPAWNHFLEEGESQVRQAFAEASCALGLDAVFVPRDLACMFRHCHFAISSIE